MRQRCLPCQPETAARERAAQQGEVTENGTTVPSDRQRRDKLVIEHLPLAMRIANWQTKRSSSRAILADDIRSAAFEGLIRAANRYVPSRGMPFAGYANKRITGAVLDFLRELDHVSVHARSRAKTAGRELPPEPLSLDQLLEDHGDWLPLEDKNADDPSLRAERAHVIAGLESAAASLPRRLRTVLFLYYTKDMTQAEVGAKMGVGDARVCQLLGLAHAALREAVGAARD